MFSEGFAMQGDVVSVGPSSLPCSDTAGIEIFGLTEIRQLAK